MKARVVLKGAKTYTLGGKRWIKDVPNFVTDEKQVKEYQANGFFSVTVLKQAPKPVEEDREDDEDESDEAEEASKGKSKKSKGLKKRA